MGTIDDDLERVDSAARETIARVYEIAREIAPDAEQGTGYGMPALVLHGKPLVSVRRTQKHLALYPFSATSVASVAGRLPGYSIDKGTIRFQVDQPLPEDVVRDVVRHRRDQIHGD